jgi:hypothetical protein
VQQDEWGAEWTQAADGPYFASGAPLASIETIAEAREHAWPAPEALQPVQALAEAAGRLRQETECAICLDLPDGPVHTTQFLRGFEQWLIDSALNQPLFEYLLDAVTEIYVAMVGPLLAAVGDAVDLVLICDDIGSQGGPLISPAAYRKLVKPRHRRILRRHPGPQPGQDPLPHLWISALGLARPDRDGSGRSESSAGLGQRYGSPPAQARIRRQALFLGRH